MQTNTTTKPKRSIELSQGQVDFLKGKITKHESKTAAAIALGISKDVLDRTIAFGSCSEKTFNTLFPQGRTTGTKKKQAAYNATSNV